MFMHLVHHVLQTSENEKLMASCETGRGPGKQLPISSSIQSEESIRKKVDSRSNKAKGRSVLREWLHGRISRPELLANPWKDSGLTERALNEFVNFQLEGHIYIWLEKLPRFQYQYFFFSDPKFSATLLCRSWRHTVVGAHSSFFSEKKKIQIMNKCLTKWLVQINEQSQPLHAFWSSVVGPVCFHQLFFSLCHIKMNLTI